MEYIIVSFRSRSETVKFSDLLNKRGIGNAIISTPKEASVGCGLSVRISPNYFEMAKRLVFANGFSSFAGFFQIKSYGGKRIVRSI